MLNPCGKRIHIIGFRSCGIARSLRNGSQYSTEVYSTRSLLIPFPRHPGYYGDKPQNPKLLSFESDLFLDFLHDGHWWLILFSSQWTQDIQRGHEHVVVVASFSTYPKLLAYPVGLIALTHGNMGK